MAASHSPLRIALNAQSIAYIELEHAVSNKYDGPVKPNEYEIRFANMARLHLYTRKQIEFVLAIRNICLNVIYLTILVFTLLFQNRRSRFSRRTMSFPTH